MDLEEGAAARLRFSEDNKLNCLQILAHYIETVSASYICSQFWLDTLGTCSGISAPSVEGSHLLHLPIFIYLDCSHLMHCQLRRWMTFYGGGRPRCVA